MTDKERILFIFNSPRGALWLAAAIYPGPRDSRRLFIWFGARHVSLLLNDDRPAMPGLQRW